MKVEKLRELLAPYRKDQEVVFAVKMQGEDCDVYSYVGDPVFRDDPEIVDSDFAENEGIKDLPFNAIIFDLDY